MSATLIQEPPPQAQAIVLPAIPVLAANAREAVILSADGEIETLPQTRAQMALAGQAVMVCHAPYTKQRLGGDIQTLDVLELFAFVHPARFCVPTPAGLAKALGLSAPQSFEDLPFTIMEAAQALLKDIGEERRIGGGKSDPLEIARAMGQNGTGWGWTPFVCAALGSPYNPEMPVMSKTAMNIWRHMPSWSEGPPPPAPSHHPVTGDESRARLAELRGHGAELREKQVEYATALTAAFAPVEEKEEPRLILAEAGTGIGKTLGYLAPASVWAEKNDGAVWISTYTKNLQRQVGQELDRLYPDPELKDKKTAVRKGRENYLCLLNLEETVAGAALSRHPHHAVAAGLMARWAEATKDGDMQGGDFPGWLPGLLGHQYTRGLADKRGECVYGACDHYHRCFIERASRKAAHANIVVANHALVMIQTALAGPGSQLPQRYVFDEGHHLFDAADSAFAGHLTARQTGDMRRWILGAEGGRKTRARGMKRRVEDLIESDASAETLLQDIMHTAHTLAGPGWAQRLKDGQPKGAAEEFLQLVHAQVTARAAGRDGPYSLETEVFPLADGIAEAARKLKGRLGDLQKPMRELAAQLRRKMNDHADTWDTDTRKRAESVCSGLERRANHTLAAWMDMLENLMQPATPDGFAEWFGVERSDGRSWDIGFYRHYIDPMAPFAAALKPHAHGIAITSATLRGRTGNEAQDWAEARRNTGSDYFTSAPSLFAAPSPYDYAAQTKIFVITDVRKDHLDQVASAYRVLFEAAGGGALGLFTAISRLRAVQERIVLPLEEAGISLYAQHVDAMDSGTLVDIFRQDTNACLLGTDAMRDGIDVPGEALRLLVYDRVPWQRPTILHKARKKVFGGKDYDEAMTRLNLRQAYGRLVRRESDRGAFVMLDSMLPSRLCTAFPEGVEVQRVGLAEAIQSIRDFLAFSVA
jgi:ATP-dependent DNA helicase DinG